MELKYKSLLNRHNQRVYVEDAIIGKYKLWYNSPLDYIYVESYKREDGTEVAGHFKLATGNPFAGIGIESNVGGGESAEHYNAIVEIIENKKYYDSIFNKWIAFDEVIKTEKHNNKIPDLSCYINKKLICCIEICETNAKSEFDILELKKINVPIIEIKNGNTRHLVLPKVLESNKQKYSELAIEIEELEKEYTRLANELQPDIVRIKSGKSKEYEKLVNWLYYRKKREFKQVSDLSREDEQFGTTKQINIDIKRIENQIEKLEYGIGKSETEINQLEFNIKQRKSAFRKIAENSKIEWFRNKWMNYNPQDLIQEIRYWLC